MSPDIDVSVTDLIEMVDGLVEVVDGATLVRELDDRLQVLVSRYESELHPG